MMFQGPEEKPPELLRTDPRRLHLDIREWSLPVWKSSRGRYGLQYSSGSSGRPEAAYVLAQRLERDVAQPHLVIWFLVICVTLLSVQFCLQSFRVLCLKKKSSLYAGG